MMKNLEDYYSNQIALLSEKLKTEKFESKIARDSQRTEMSKMKQELRAANIN